jgi:hypothetical protein
LSESPIFAPFRSKREFHAFFPMSGAKAKVEIGLGLKRTLGLGLEKIFESGVRGTRLPPSDAFRIWSQNVNLRASNVKNPRVYRRFAA